VPDARRSVRGYWLRILCFRNVSRLMTGSRRTESPFLSLDRLEGADSRLNISKDVSTSWWILKGNLVARDGPGETDLPIYLLFCFHLPYNNLF
jgi:hypothetical protein